MNLDINYKKISFTIFTKKLIKYDFIIIYIIFFCHCYIYEKKNKNPPDYFIYNSSNYFCFYNYKK